MKRVQTGQERLQGMLSVLFHKRLKQNNSRGALEKGPTRRFARWFFNFDFPIFHAVRVVFGLKITKMDYICEERKRSQHSGELNTSNGSHTALFAFIFLDFWMLFFF
jgi:hypothetical protein